MELEEKRTELITAEARREPIPRSKLTVGAYLEEWLERLAKPRVRPTTFVAYGNYVDKHLVPELGKKPVGRLSAREVRLADRKVLDLLDQYNIPYAIHTP